VAEKKLSHVLDPKQFHENQSYH